MAAAWWEALFGSPVVDAPPERLRVCHEQLRAWEEAGRRQGAETFRVCFRLDPPEIATQPSPAYGSDDGAAAETWPPRQTEASPGRAPASATWHLRYLLQANDDPSLLVPAGEVWGQRGATARFLNRRLAAPQERLLAGLGRAARLFPPLEASLREARPVASALSTAQAHDFLREAAVVLQAAGFGVLVPGLEARLRLRLRLRSGTPDRARSAGVAGFTRESLVAYDWEAALGNHTLSREEFEHLVRLKEPLVQVRGQWIELDPEQVQKALAFFQHAGDLDGDGVLSLQEALRLALDPDAADDTGLPIEQVEAEGWVDDLLRVLRQGEGRAAVAEPPGFVGALRPYQKVGVAWLATLRRYGLGACLADDMGLGKTPTLIALLLHGRRPDAGDEGVPGAGAPGPTLVVCPTSVVGNWQRELARFAPSLRVLVHFGAGRRREPLAAVATRHDVVLSTYALLHRDETDLLAVPWDGVVLDEAQNVKNASTKAAQTARRLPARWRAALTGTPVENRLSELWSLFHFLNPGYLGGAEAFRKGFANPIERADDAETRERLKKLVAPFLLRRVKTDRAIIRDLPEKQEMKVFCPLTPEQATLYEAVVRDGLGEIEEAEGIARRGRVLATLTRLKQVCDHPALFLHDGSALEGRSGKLTRLAEMLEEALAVDDRALIFTQYAEMGRLLEAHLEARFGQEVLFLHGGTPALARDRMVARFQSGERHAPRLFLLSLKAGGTGLNLTAANHVFHFDRWWNPAVENQATDRAFRIGQRRDVQVHKLVCAGTLEEALDQLIERKLALAQAIVGAGETWITELSTAALRDLFALRHGAAEVMAG
jgi:SNF2 family DNA or RNA helicase